MIITNQIMRQGKSSNGGWSKKQLQLLGVPIRGAFNIPKGWKKKIIGTKVPQKTIDRFISLKDKHLKNRNKIRLANLILDPPLDAPQLSDLLSFKDKGELL